MKSLLYSLASLSCFVFSGNAQDAVPPAYVTQGNVQQNRSTYENELQRAAQEARQKKELMASMAASGGTAPPVITTAEQFLAADRPPMPAPSEPRPAPVRGEAYVPSFDAPSTNTGSTPAGSFEMPEKERSFFKWLKTKKKKTTDPTFEPVGASDYTNPYEEPGNADTAESAPAPPAPIPDAPAMNEPAPPVPSVTAAPVSEGPAPIFVPRETGFPAGAEIASIKKDTEIFADEVLVRVFAGTQVAVMGQNKDDVAIQLSDGRLGVIKKKFLAR